MRREWTVFPFLFRLRAPADALTIRTDWEHESWGWHDPDAVVRGDDGRGSGEACLSAPTVPRLAESLRRVWFEADLGAAAGGVLARGLDALARDHESGARQLAGAALQTLRGVVAALGAPGAPGDDGAAPLSGEEWWARVRFAAWHLWKNGRESMGAAILSALLAALAGVEQAMARCEWPSAWRGVALGELDARIAARQESARRVSDAFAAYLARTFPSRRESREPIAILTLSESSTIRQALRHAAVETGFALDLRVLESRPLFEGVALAGGLAGDLAALPSSAQDHKVTLYPDASAALAATGVDVVLLGADRIAASGAVSNKTGSLPAVLGAKHVCAAARVVVLGESEKVAPPGRPEDHVVEDNDPSQVSRAWDSEYNTTRVREAADALRRTRAEPGRVRIEIRNVFFEWFPAGLVDAYITESGEWTVHDIAQHSEKLAADEKRLFGDL